MKKLLSILIICGLLMNLSFVFAEEDLVGEADFNLVSWLKHIFNINSFSVVGDTRQCSLNADETFYFDSGESMSAYANAATYCSSGHGLIDIYVDGWNPSGEYKDSASVMCGSHPQGCIIEIYCCPFDECTGDSQCSNWYGGGSTCESMSSSDPNILYKSGSTFSYCTAPGQELNCYYVFEGQSSCVERTYYTTDICPTYMSRQPYTSRSTCESNICDNGVKKNEGDTCGTCPNSGPFCNSGLTCANFQCVSPAQCGDNICQTPETKTSCPADCGIAPVCGDGNCDAGETEGATYECPADCEGGNTCSDIGTNMNSCRARNDCVFTRTFQCKDLTSASCSEILYETGCDKFQECHWSVGLCRAGQGDCNTEFDTNCDGSVDRTELGVAIQSWLTGSVTRDKLGEAISAWAAN